MTSIISLGILGDLVKESRELLQVCSDLLTPELVQIQGRLSLPGLVCSDIRQNSGGIAVIVKPSFVCVDSYIVQSFPVQLA